MIKFWTNVILLPIFLLPRIVKRFVAYLLTLGWYYLFPIRKKVIINNIKIAFPDLNKKEVNHLAFRSVNNWALTLIEYSYFPFISDRGLNQIVEIQGLENIRKALEKGRGVLILGTHTGNGELAIYKTCREGLPLYLIGRKVNNKFINDGLFYIREKSGLKHLDPSKSSLKVVKALKQNEGLFFVIDQFTYPPIGIKSTFFGKVTGTNSSLAYFALRFKAPVIPGFSYRKNGKIIVCFGEEIETETPYASVDENVSYMTQKYNSWIEGVIRKHPESWMWIHRRWKKYF